MPRSEQERHGVITCGDDKLNPVLAELKQDIESEGNVFITPDRPFGGVHAMTHGTCRQFFYDQLDVLIEVFGATCIHIFPHTSCRFNKLKQWQKIGKTPEHDLRFQIETLDKVLLGSSEHIAATYPDRIIDLDVRIIQTPEQRIITREQAISLLSDRSHHPHGSYFLNQSACGTEA